MTKLAVRLLGGYQVELAGEAVHGFETDKARALLAYLIVEADRPHRRETLTGLLWPDRPEVAARANLRQTLTRVRRALRDYEPPFFLFITPTDVQFNTASDYTLDAGKLSTFAHGPAALPRLLPEAYCADFLAGFAVPDSEAFQAWTLTKQEYYHRLAIEILDEQNAYFEETGDYEQAAAAARLQLRLEPWLDEAHRRCMRGLALAGRREEALRQYEVCVRVLRAELDVEPAASTKTLYAEILAGALHAPAPTVPPPVYARQAVAPSPAQAALVHATPVGPTGALVARADELGRLSRHLDAALGGETMVAFVSGDAGTGKSTLLETFAAEAMAEHPDLLVADARCHPGGGVDPCAPLRRLAELLFGDLDKDIAWRPTNREQVARLQHTTGLTLAALAEYGPSLIDTLVSATSVQRRAARRVDPLPREATARRQAAWPATAMPVTKSESPAASQIVLFDQLIYTLAAIARQNPLLILLDDLHWVDDATANFLLQLGRELSNSRIFLLGAFRSATVALGRRAAANGEVLRHPLAAVVNELCLTKGEILVELDRVDGRAFVEAYVDQEPNRLGASFRDALYAQTGGHALFTVELLRNLQKREVLLRDEVGRWTSPDAFDWGALPIRVEAAIAERIDHLPQACRQILSCASVLGDEFAGEVVAELVGSTPGEVLACLSDTLARQHHLVHPERLQRLGGGGRLSIYRFTHHLFQKYVFDRLDPVERGQLHAAAASCLEQRAGNDPGEVERLSLQLAWHYEAGGLPLQAARALYNAGCQAMRLSAFREARDRFDHGLALLLDEPPSPARIELTRLLETARLGPQRNLEGIGAADYAGTLDRAAAVWASDAQGRPELMLLSGQAERLWAKGQFHDALTVAGRLLEQATQQGQEDFVALAHWCFGFIYIGMGDAGAAQSHLNWLANWLSAERTAAVRSAVGLDIAATSLAFLAVAEWWLGYPEKARVLCTQAVNGAVERGDVYGQVFASAIGASMLFFLRSEDATQEEWSEQCRRLCVQHGFSMWPVYGEVFLGRVTVLRGGPAAASGIDRMRRAIDGWQAAGMAVGTGSLVVVLADSCLAVAARDVDGRDGSPAAGEERAGLLAVGLSAVEDVLGPAKVVSSQAHEPELHRLRGELLLARDGLAASQEVLACFTKALDLAHAKGILAWELRAAMSLVRLQVRLCEDRAQLPAVARANGHTALEEARGCLYAVYLRYTEGFAYPDLQEAAALCSGHVGVVRRQRRQQSRTWACELNDDV